MLQSHLFSKTIRNVSNDVKSVSHRLLLRAGFVFSVAAGIYALSPLGFRVVEKIKNIIREEFNKLGAQEMIMPILHPAHIWKTTGRLEGVGKELWKIENRDGENFVLAMTHEEVAGYLAQNIIQTYKDLPLTINQFQTKIRDELRPRGGMLRLREFLMQDAYSFDKDEKGLNLSYKKFYDSYQRIFKRLSLDAVAVEASGGVMGEGKSHEFMLISEIGEDKIAVCEKCDFRANIEIMRNQYECPQCKTKLQEKKSIELGQTFQLGLKYSQPFNVKFKDQNGQNHLVYMGSYGIGIERAMAAVVESHYDERGIIWPDRLSPFRVHLISLGQKTEAEKIYKDLLKYDIDVLYDDRFDKTPGEKFTDADLIGITYRIVVSEKTLAKKSIEIKRREEQKVKLIKTENLISVLMSNF